MSDTTLSPTNLDLSDSTRQFSFLSEYRWPLVITAGFLPLMFVHLVNLWNREQYQHFPLVIAMIIGLVWTRMERIDEEHAGPYRRWLAALCWTPAFLILFVATYFFSPWIAAVGFVFACGGLLATIRERYKLHNAFGIWMLLWLLIPVPGSYEQRLSQTLQTWTTSISGQILQYVYIPNIVEGTVLSLPTQRLFVEEACSGIISMMAIIATCLLIAVLANRSLLHAILLTLSGLLWASVMNIVRIVSIGIFSERYGSDLSVGWPHTALGLVVFTGAVVMVISTDKLLQFALHSGDHEKFQSDSLTIIVRLWIWMVGVGEPVIQKLHPKDPDAGRFGVPTLIIAILFAMTGLTGLATGMNRLRTGQEVAFTGSVGDIPQRLTEEILPDEIDNWELVEFRDKHTDRLFAQKSRVWVYRRGSIEAIFAVDFAFPRWHDLTVCYESIGWNKEGASEVSAIDENGTQYLKSKFFKNQIDQGYLLYGLTERNGDSVRPPDAMTPVGQMRQRMEPDRTMFQIQIWATKEGDFSDEDFESIEKIYQQLRNIVAGELAEATSPSSDSPSSDSSRSLSNEQES